MILFIYFLVSEVFVLICFFLVKGNKCEVLMWLKVYKFIFSSRVVGFEVRMMIGFCFINEIGVLLL